MDPVRVTTISLSRPWMEAVGPQAVASWVRIVTEVADAAQETTPAAVTDQLQQRLAAVGLTSDHVVLRGVAEMLADPERGVLVIASSDGTVLHGPAQLGPTQRPMEGPATDQDPEDPDRPAYS